MLGADVVVLENAGLLLGEDDHLPGPFSEALKHGSCLSVGFVGGFGYPVLSLLIAIYANPMGKRFRITGHRGESTNALQAIFGLNRAVNAGRGCGFCLRSGP